MDYDSHTRAVLLMLNNNSVQGSKVRLHRAIPVPFSDSVGQYCLKKYLRFITLSLRF